MQKGMYNPSIATFFIFHGTGGTPEGNWFPWLKAELQSQGHTVITPAFPDAEHPDLKTWMAQLEREQRITGDAILIGHSLGGTLILRILETLKIAVHGCVLVAPVSEPMSNDFDPLVATFIDHPFDWAKIRSNGGRMTILHSDNDPYVPLSHARTLADHTGASLNVIAGGKHLNRSAGFTTFPLLRDLIQ